MHKKHPKQYQEHVHSRELSATTVHTRHAACARPGAHQRLHALCQEGLRLVLHPQQITFNARSSGHFGAQQLQQYSSKSRP